VLKGIEEGIRIKATVMAKQNLYEFYKSLNKAVAVLAGQTWTDARNTYLEISQKLLDRSNQGYHDFESNPCVPEDIINYYVDKLIEQILKEKTDGNTQTNHAK
jgi:hypothetical protein